MSVFIQSIVELLQEEGFVVVYNPGYVTLIKTINHTHRFYIIDGKIVIWKAINAATHVAHKTNLDLADPKLIDKIKNYLDANK